MSFLTQIHHVCILWVKNINFTLCCKSYYIYLRNLWKLLTRPIDKSEHESHSHHHKAVHVVAYVALWQCPTCCLGSDCQLNNLPVMGSQNIWRLPAITAPTDRLCAYNPLGVCSHWSCLLSLFTLGGSESVFASWLTSAGHRQMTRHWIPLLTVAITG